MPTTLAIVVAAASTPNPDPSGWTHSIAVEVVHDVVTHDVSLILRDGVRSLEPKLKPKIVDTAELVLGVLRLLAVVIIGASNENTIYAVLINVDSVTIACEPEPMPSGRAQRINVLVDHATVWHDVNPRDAEILVATNPKLKPRIVTLAPPDVGAFFVDE